MKLKKFKCAGLFAALGSVLLLAGCEKAEIVPQEFVPRVEVLTLGQVESTDSLFFPAVAHAAQRSRLSFRVSGEVLELNVREGDQVNQGDVIASLDTRDYQIEVDNARAKYQGIDSQYRRSKPLVEKGLLAESQFDELAAQRQIALAELNLARLYLEFTTLTAPIDGIISSVAVDRFENVQVGQPIINIHSVDRVEVLIQVPDRVFMHQPDEPDARGVTAKVKVESGNIYDAQVQEFTTEPDPNTGTYTLTLGMPMPSQEVILDGMAVEVTARPNQAGLDVNPGTRIPLQAIVNVDGDTLDRTNKFVWLLNGDAVSRRQVELGKVNRNTVQVINGLQGTETIVVKGLSQLREGMKVDVIKKEAAL